MLQNFTNDSKRIISRTSVQPGPWLMTPTTIDSGRRRLISGDSDIIAGHRTNSDTAVNLSRFQSADEMSWAVLKSLDQAPIRPRSAKQPYHVVNTKDGIGIVILHKVLIEISKVDQSLAIRPQSWIIR